MENNDDNDNDQLDLGFEEEEDADGDGAGNNNNILAEIDLDEDDEENENDSILDGGVAVNPDEDATKAKKHSSECDLVSRFATFSTRKRFFSSFSKLICNIFPFYLNNTLPLLPPKKKASLRILFGTS